MSLENIKNKLLILEGEDHTGKSTVGRLLVDKLNDNDIKAIYAFQPGDNDGDYNQIINDMCKTKIYDLDPLSNLFAFLLDRSEHTSKKVIPALDSGKTVVCDRWWYSTIAYQFFGKQLLQRFQLTEDFAYWMNRVASHNVKPHYSFYLQRKQELIDSEENTALDLFENETNTFKSRVHNAYMKMVAQGDLQLIQVSNDPEITIQRILELT